MMNARKIVNVTADCSHHASERVVWANLRTGRNAEATGRLLQSQSTVLEAAPVRPVIYPPDVSPRVLDHVGRVVSPRAVRSLAADRGRSHVAAVDRKVQTVAQPADPLSLHIRNACRVRRDLAAGRAS